MKKAVLFFFLVSGLGGLAQNSPIKVTIFSSDSAAKQAPVDNTNKSGSDAGLYHNLVKWNYMLLGRGVLMVNFEKHVMNQFTLELGVGVTYSDFVFTMYYQEMGELYRKNFTSSGSGPNGPTQRLLPNPFEEGTKGFGFAVEVSPRFYFSKDEFEGAYAAPYLSFRKYNYGINDYGNATNSADFSDLSYSFFDAAVKLGYQYYFRYNDQLYYDAYIGFGYRSATVNTMMITDNNYSGGIYTGGGETHSVYTQSLGLPQVLFGAKIGYAF